MTVVTKANILKKTDGKFTALCHEVAADYPEITVDDYYIDIMAANLVNERVRGQFQVLLLPNLYGDIITDEAAQLQGGVGTAGSANIGDRYAMFEAIHGSAPRMIERGMGDYANPQSILRAEVMLLRHIGRAAAADRLEAALDACPAVITGRRDLRRLRRRGAEAALKHTAARPNGRAAEPVCIRFLAQRCVSTRDGK